MQARETHAPPFRLAVPSLPPSNKLHNARGMYANLSHLPWKDKNGGHISLQGGYLPHGARQVAPAIVHPGFFVGFVLS